MPLNSVFVFLFTVLVMVGLPACNNNLMPSGEDKRAGVEAGSEGNQPTQKLADFTLKDIDGNDRHLSEFLKNGAVESDAVVIYFTMWCSICLAHSDHLLNSVVPKFESQGKVSYLLIDYVSYEVSAGEASAQANGLANSEFIVLVDDGNVREQLGGNMAISLVVDNDGTVLMNQEFGSGTQLEEAIATALND